MLFRMRSNLRIAINQKIHTMWHWIFKKTTPHSGLFCYKWMKTKRRNCSPQNHSKSENFILFEFRVKSRVVLSLTCLKELSKFSLPQKVQSPIDQHLTALLDVRVVIFVSFWRDSLETAQSPKNYWLGLLIVLFERLIKEWYFWRN